VDTDTWYAFIKNLRARQDELRAELEPYESGTMQVGTRPYGGEWRDTTAETINTIKGEIASIERTIQNVIAEQGLHDA